MTNTTKLFELAQLAEASYADFTKSDKKAALIIVNFSSAQADDFLSNWQDIHHQKDTTGVLGELFHGFSATLFKYIGEDNSANGGFKPGDLVYAIRGTSGVLSDLIPTDGGDIVLDGLALDQIVDMYNDWQRINAGAGNHYWAAELKTDVALTAARALLPPAELLAYDLTLTSQGYIIDKPLGLVRFIAKDWSDVIFQDERAFGDVTINMNNLVDITGHSLGGHLADAFTRLFPGLAEALTINGAGYPTGVLPGLGLLADQNIANLFQQLGGQSSFDAGVIHNIYGDKMPQFVTMDLALGLKQQGSHDALFIEQSPFYGNLLGHAAGQMTDSLAVANLFFLLDAGLAGKTPGEALAQLNALFEISSNQADQSLEKLVEGLSGFILGTRPTITVDDRESLYSAIKDLMGDHSDPNSQTTFDKLIGNITLTAPPTSVDVVRTDFSAFLSLVYLTPFALKAVDIETNVYLETENQTNLDLALKWEQDKTLTPVQIANGERNYSDTWIKDRIAMISWLQVANAEDTDSITLSPSMSLNTSKHYDDFASGKGIILIGQGNEQQIIFGDDTDNGAIAGLAGDDHLYGDDGNDTLSGNNGKDYLEGGLGDDILIGGADNDKLLGGPGNDTYHLQTTGGIDTILDHSGSDQIQIAGMVVSGEFKPVVDGGKVYYSADKAYELRPMLDATATIWRLSVRDAGTGEYQAVADIDGWHEGAFSITSTAVAEAPNPKRVALSYSNSVAYLNMNGAAATQGVQFDGGTKSDSFTGSNYSDIITTGDGLSNLVLSTYGGNDSVQGGDSRDYIRTGSNGASTTVSDNDYAAGGAQSDVLLGGYGSDQLWGDADDGIWLVDSADSGERGDWLNGENGNDSLYGSRSSDVAFGGAGEDLLRGGAGDDLLLGDARYAPYSRATALPYSAATTQSYRWDAATAGMVKVLAGNYSLDPVMVASGNAFSWLWSVASDDYTLTTPAGFVSEKRLDQGGGGDILDGGLGNDWLAGQTGDDYLEGGDGNDMLYGDDKDGLMTATDQGDDVVLGGAGADRLYGGNGDDLLGGGPGDDTVYGGAGQDIIYFNQGDGHDTVFDPDPEPGTTLIFGKGISRDDITLHLGSLLLDLGNGDEIHIEGFDPHDVFNSANAYLFGFADGTALTLASLLARGFDLSGAEADDRLTGTNTVDRIQGLVGNDTLQGGAGDDRLDGGIGNDTFIFNRGDGQDEITDGKLASADIEAIQFTDVASTDVSFSRPQGTDDLLLTYGSGDHVVVDGFFGANTTDGMAHFLFSDGVALTRYADIVALLPTTGNTAPALTGAPALLADGTEDTARMIAAADLLQGYSDADGDILSVDSLTASNGTLADNHDGSWIFSPSVNYYGPVALSYNVIDGNGGSVAASQNFNLAAVNDAPVGIATAVLVSGLEDTGYAINAADLLQGFSDVDDDTLSVASLIADNGSLVDQNNGAWTYTPTADFNGVVALRYDVVDGNGGSVAAAVDLIVNPVNDLPVVRDIAATVGEDGPAVNFAADYSDVDSGDQHTVTIDTTATQGQVIHDNGHFSYDPSGRFESLPQGVTATDTFLYSVDDGYGDVTKTATITLLGVNDAAVIGGVDVWDLTETDELLATGGTLTISDPDNGEAGFRTQTEIAGSQGLGVFGIDADGKWTYSTHTAHDEFVDGQVYADSWVVKSTDGTEHTLTVNITGTNDAAKITGTSTVDLIETDAPLTSGGQLMATDVDSLAGFVAQTGAIGSGGYGKFSIDEAGTWAYVMDNAHDEFKASQTYTDAITVTTADGTPQVLTIRIQGSNDAPVTPDIDDVSTIENTTTILPLIPNRVTDAENDPIAVTGLLGFTWNGSLAVTNPVTKAGVELSALTPSIATDGASIRFTAPAEFDWMTAGQTITCSFDYTVQETATPASRSIGKITLIINGQTNAGTGLSWTGSHGADNKTGTSYEDSLQGLNGNDQLTGEDRTDALYGGNGNDSLDGGNGIDYVYGNNGNDSLLGGADGDFLYAGNGDDAVNGGNGNDAMAGDQGNDTLVGDLGNDSLYGGQGDDQLNGGDSNDRLAGGAGDDQLVGGAGQDNFVFGKGGAEDQILDFSIADGDLIQISRDTGITHFAQLLKGMEAEQGGIEIKLGEGGEVFLVGVAVAELSTEQFVFA